MKKQIEIGKKYGRLTIIKEVDPNKWNYRRVLCKCDCGNETTITLNNLRINHTKSCGCLNDEKRIERISIQTLSHGESNKTSEYRSWISMKQRCYNKNYPDYNNWGGRGIKVCNRWIHSYENFLEDMGRKPESNYTLDRINNEGNYEPSNCRWATYKEQANNRRPKSKIKL